MENKHVLRWQRASASPERPSALTAAEAERIVAESNRRLATAERHHRRFVAAMAEARTAAAITEARLRYSGRGSPAKGQRDDDGNASRSQSVTRTTSMNSSAHLPYGSAAASRSPSLGRGRQQYQEAVVMAADGGVGGGDAQQDGDHLEASSVFEFTRTVSSSGVVSGLGASHHQHRAGSVSSRSGVGMDRSASAASSSAAGPRGHSGRSGGGGGGFYVSAARNPTERDSKGNYNAKAPPRTTTVASAAPPVRSTSAFSSRRRSAASSSLATTGGAGSRGASIATVEGGGGGMSTDLLFCDDATSVRSVSPMPNFRPSLAAKAAAGGTHLGAPTGHGRHILGGGSSSARRHKQSSSSPSRNERVGATPPVSSSSPPRGGAAVTVHANVTAFGGSGAPRSHRGRSHRGRAGTVAPQPTAVAPPTTVGGGFLFPQGQGGDLPLRRRGLSSVKLPEDGPPSRPAADEARAAAAEAIAYLAARGYGFAQAASSAPAAAPPRVATAGPSSYASMGRAPIDLDTSSDDGFPLPTAARR